MTIPTIGELMKKKLTFKEALLIQCALLQSPWLIEDFLIKFNSEK